MQVAIRQHQTVRRLPANFERHSAAYVRARPQLGDTRRAEPTSQLLSVRRCLRMQVDLAAALLPVAPVVTAGTCGGG